MGCPTQNGCPVATTDIIVVVVGGTTGDVALGLLLGGACRGSLLLWLEVPATASRLLALLLGGACRRFPWCPVAVGATVGTNIVRMCCSFACYYLTTCYIGRFVAFKIL